MIVNGKWKAIPFGNVGQLMNWRTDWFAEVGIKDFPDTWDGLLEAGIKLKKAGHPFGFELGHGFGDNHGWLYPLLWSYGAREVEPDGKTIVIDSDETARAIDFCRKFFQQTMFEDVPGLDRSVSNNKAWMSRADLVHQQRREHSVVRQEAVPGYRQGDAAVAQSARAEGTLPHPRTVEPRDLQLLPGPAGGEGLPGLADGPEAGRALVCIGRQLLRAVPACLRQRAVLAASSRATCRTAIR